MTPFCRVKWSEQWFVGNGTQEMRRFNGVLMSEAVLKPCGRWTCIVATPSGNREMNPLDLTVTGVWVPGEPLEPEQ